MAVHFGVFDWVDVHPRRSIADVYDDRIALARRADAGDFTRFHIAEHHGATLGLAASPGLFAAALARETERLRLVPTTFIVPLYDPLRLVQEIAMIDQLSHGRLEIGVGKGSSPHEAAMYGFTREEMTARYDTFVPAILDALQTGVFVPPGGGEPVELTITPTGPLPVWYPTGNPESIRMTAENGQNTIFGFAFKSPPVPVIREHRDLFDEISAEVHPGQPVPLFGVLRHVLVAETDARAFEIAEEAFAAHYDNFTWLWRRRGTPQPPQPELRTLVDEHLLFIGSPASVAEQIAQLVDATRIDYLACAFAWGTISREDALRSIDLFDTEVIPALRGRGV
jgi:alkanesulfonate monooxygenase SsuD/methylene tetrahydromethanopterin reductase-like flavin-dependent oxidoreductase (luciferase family)